MYNYKNLADRDLVSLLKTGDREAFAQIYERYAMILYYKVNQVLRDEEASKDIIQELFTYVWEKSDKLKEDQNLSGYLYIASRSRVLNLIKKGNTRSDYLTEVANYSVNITDETTEKLDEKELFLLVASEIAKLPEKMREVFQLSRIEDLSHKEIAERLNISETTVKKQVQNALKILRDRLSKFSSYGLLLLIFIRE
ncbi:RNA polymerase sigma-70 factor, ECF subfamily [Sphingobacterium nematocida]|uniref:RNA polymerase sigma-70 factor, ECF subfamily n=1 Tax=Sphingobacterium nematocida TaxID=1513896 RepID=A0A1T5BRV0_9SPHI|nr:RNA polymerase sigma-70 factor [Sphingobacterium nematocida]SKB49550.1 RNA polymerase sigma-70 factor, ECF subfamily [Sphingobacterium nematocida]